MKNLKTRIKKLEIKFSPAELLVVEIDGIYYFNGKKYNEEEFQKLNLRNADSIIVEFK